jgi:hypothetical protein
VAIAEQVGVVVDVEQLPWSPVLISKHYVVAVNLYKMFIVLVLYVYGTRSVALSE